MSAISRNSLTRQRRRVTVYSEFRDERRGRGFAVGGEWGVVLVCTRETRTMITFPRCCLQTPTRVNKTPLRHTPAPTRQAHWLNYMLPPRGQSGMYHIVLWNMRYSTFSRARLNSCDSIATRRVVSSKTRTAIPTVASDGSVERKACESAIMLGSVVRVVGVDAKDDIRLWCPRRRNICPERDSDGRRVLSVGQCKNDVHICTRISCVVAQRCAAHTL